MKKISVIKDELTRRVMKELRARVVSSLGNIVKKVVLYGSYARNEQHRDSDIDFMVFIEGVPGDHPEIRKKLTEIQVDLSLEYDVVVSILLKDYGNFVKNRTIIPFFTNIYNEGVAVYG